MVDADELQAVEELGIPEAITALVNAAKNYVAAVDALRGPLEADIRAAVEACWDIVEKQVQLRGKPFMRKKIKLLDAVVQPDGEQFLARGLQQWQKAAEGAVGSAALEVRIAERRLLYAVDRLTSDMDQPPQLYFSLLHILLRAVSSMGAPTLLSCPTTFHLIRNLALYIGATLMELEGDEVDLYCGLVSVLQQHVASCDWALPLLYPPVKLLPQLLKHIVGGGQVLPPSTGVDDDGAQIMTGDTCRSRVLLFEQLPWQDLHELDLEQVKTEVVPWLLDLLNQCCGSLLARNEDAEELLGRVLDILVAAARQLPQQVQCGLQLELLLGVLAVSCGKTVKGLLSAYPDLAAGEALNRTPLPSQWIKVAWGNTHAAGSVVASRLVQKLPWQDVAGKVPGHLVCVLFLSIASGSRHDTERKLHQFYDWVMTTLSMPIGRRIITVDVTDEGHMGPEGMVEACTTQVPPTADSTVRSLWSILVIHQTLCLLALNHKQLDVNALLQKSHLAQLLCEVGRGSLSTKHTMVTMALAQAVKSLARFSPQDVAPHVAGLSLVWETVAMGDDVSETQEQLACRTVKRQMYELMVENLSASSAISQKSDHHFVGAATLWISIFVHLMTVSDPPTGVLYLVNDITQLLYYYHPKLSWEGEPTFLSATVQLLDDSKVVQLSGKLFSMVGEESFDIHWLSLLACWLYNLGAPASTSPDKTGAPTSATVAGSGSLDDLPSLDRSKLTQCSSNFQQVISDVAEHVPNNSFALDDDEETQETMQETQETQETTQETMQETQETMRETQETLQETQETTSSITQDAEAVQPKAITTPISEQPHAADQSEAVLDAGLAIQNEQQLALRIQDAAIATRRGGACLPLWEELIVLYCKEKEQVEPVILRDEVSRALARLAELYELKSPLMSDIATRWAPLNIDAMEGTVRLLSSNADVVRELMMSYPLRLGPANLTHLLPQDPPSTDPPPHPVSTMYPRRPRVTSDSFANFLLQQADVAEDLRDVMAVLHFWTLRAEKQLARPMSTLSDDDIDGDLFDPELHMADGEGEGEIPDIIAQAQAKLWDCSSSWSAELTSISQQLQNLVQLRYSKIHPEVLDAERFMAHDVIESPEDPSYHINFQNNREKAMSSVIQFSEGDGLTAAAAALHQVEVLLLHAHITAKAGAKESSKDVVVEDREVDLKCQLMTVIARVILDGSSPAICMPFFHHLYSQAAAGIVPLNLKTKLRIVRCILQSLHTSPSSHSGSAASSRQDSAVLFTSLLDPQALLEANRLDDFFSCLKSVIRHCPKNSGPATNQILSCFDIGRYIAVLSEQGAFEVSEPGVKFGTHAAEEGSSSGPSGVHSSTSPKCATQLLSLALEALDIDGATSTACQIIEGVVCSCPPRYFVAAVHCGVCAPTGSSRAAVLRVLMNVPQEALPLAVMLEACVQLSDALNANRMIPDDIPHDFLVLLLSSEALWTAVIENIKGVYNSYGRDGALYYTATSQLPGSRSASADAGAPSSAPSSPRGGNPAPLCLIQISGGMAAVVVLRELIGAMLQSMVRKYGGGAAEGLAEDLARLLMLLFDPVATHPQLVDWVWNLYKEQLQPFLELAVPSDSGAVMRFRECWLSLPWMAARFLVESPEALSEYAGYLLSKDHAAADLLPLLNWDPVMRRMASIRNNAQEPPNEDVVRWATEFALFALQACVLMQREDLPPFLNALIWREGVNPTSLGHSLPSSPRLMSEEFGEAQGVSEEEMGVDPLTPLDSPRKLSMTDILCASDWQRLESVMLQHVGGSPWLLQPLVLSPSVVAGPPGYRIVHALRLLKSGAEARGTAQAAKVSSAVTEEVMFVSVVHDVDGQMVGVSPVKRGAYGVGESWHLSVDEHEELVCGVLLPLAMLHSSFRLAEAGFSEDDDLPVSLPSSASQIPNLIDPSLVMTSSGAVESPHIQPSNQQPMTETSPVSSLISVLRARAQVVTITQALPFANAAAPLQPGGPKSDSELMVVYAEPVQQQLAEMILESCKRGPLYWPPSLMRVCWVSARLRSSPEVIQLMEAVLHLLMLRLIHKGPSTPRRLVSHDRFGSSLASSYDDGERVSLQPVVAELEPDDQDQLADFSTDLHVKTMSHLTLLQLQCILETAVLASAPLVATLCLERLRQAAISVEGGAWEDHALIALRHAAIMALPQELPEHIVAVWLQVLCWLADSRCQAVMGEEWLQLLADFLNTLNLHIRHVQVAEGLLLTNEPVPPAVSASGAALSHEADVHPPIAAKLDPANMRGQFAKIGNFFGRTMRAGVDNMNNNNTGPEPLAASAQPAGPRVNPFAELGSRFRRQGPRQRGSSDGDTLSDTLLPNSAARPDAQRAKHKGLWGPFAGQSLSASEEPMSPPNEFSDPFAVAVVQDPAPFPAQLASQLSPRLRGLATRISHKERMEEQSSGAILSAEPSDDEGSLDERSHSQQESLMSPSRLSRSHSITLAAPTALTPKQKSPETSPQAAPVHPLGFLGRLTQLPRRLNVAPNRQQQKAALTAARSKETPISSDRDAHVRIAVAACLIGFHIQMVLCPWLDQRINPESFAHFDHHMLHDLLSVPSGSAIADARKLPELMDTNMALEDFQSSIQATLFPHAAYILKLASSE